MSTIYTATGSERASASTQRATGLIRRYLDTFCAWLIRENLHATLDDLSDRELHDIGVTRGEIDYLVRAIPLVDPRDFQGRNTPR